MSERHLARRVVGQSGSSDSYQGIASVMPSAKREAEGFDRRVLPKATPSG
jgi:hypothetical protein